MSSFFARCAVMEQSPIAGGGGGGGGPLPETGLLARLRADTITGADGSQVASWPGMVGGDDASQVTSGNQPILVASDINAQPSVRFNKSGLDATSAWINWDSVSGSDGIFSLLAVVRPDYAADGYDVIVGASLGFGVTIYHDSGGFVDGSVMVDKLGSGGASAIITDPGGLPDAAPAAILLGFAYNNTASRYVYVNAGARTLGWTNDTIPLFTTGTILAVGRDVNNPASHDFKGTIAEIAKWDHILDSTERDEVFSYTLGRYGV